MSLKLKLRDIYVWLARGGVLPCICLIGICRPKRYGFCSVLVLKTTIDFAYFGLNSGMALEGIRECMNAFVVSIPNENERKSNMRIRNGF